ncbi:hypothetical protein JHK82_056909 [Glycine max]|uniref:Uncharacterized protein n=2 Tax=Glycine subgen. Soja TaxID=1462606 RepID=A0A0R0ENQ8_SOYBN|nr:hypothetical protein JHK86_056745 [Glycine max]KAG4910901.1 hypothetical protein JHK87_057017 [Glycine soja]KAG4919478.1 hypothetical protein JHK85_057759 [Glycine max]KAG5075555.1 hypothetical protein JHK84_056786 [Glycine max]KAG5078214.1 hypothetical protein JHK82_056909 [Glycine max]
MLELRRVGEPTTRSNRPSRSGFSCEILKGSDRVWCWGVDSILGEEHMCAIRRSNSSVICWWCRRCEVWEKN